MHPSLNPPLRSLNNLAYIEKRLVIATTLRTEDLNHKAWILWYYFTVQITREQNTAEKEKNPIFGVVQILAILESQGVQTAITLPEL